MTFLHLGIGETLVFFANGLLVISLPLLTLVLLFLIYHKLKNIEGLLKKKG
jgi:hypothetical protein